MHLLVRSLNQDQPPQRPPRFTRFWSIALISAMISVLFLGMPSRAAGQSGGPIISNAAAGAIIGGIAGIGAAIAIVTVVSISHARHTISGCVSMGANGLALQTSDKQIYLLQGIATGVTAGDRVKVHGSKVKSASCAANTKTFVVEKLQKDYGACR